MSETSSNLDLQASNKKMDYIAWGAFIAMWAATFVVQQVTHVDLRNGQYVAVGVILLGLNAARYFRGIPMSRITVVLGLLALAGGTVRQFNGELTVIPAVLITAGSLLLAQGILMLERR